VPIQIAEDDGSGVVTSVYSIVGNSSSVSVSSGKPIGFSSAPARADYTSWKRNFYNKTNGQLVKSLRYHDIPSSGDGTHLANYYVTAYAYDSLGRKTTTIQTVQSTAGYKDQISAVIYDLLDRVSVTKSDSGDSGVDTDADSDLGTLSLGGLATQTQRFYDGELGIGDSHVTRLQTYHTASVYTETTFHRTYRGFLRGASRSYYSGSASDVTPYSVIDVDWMGRTVAAASYSSGLNTGSSTWDTVLGDDDYTATIDSNDRHDLVKTSYDKLGRVYRTESVPGRSANAIQINNYYDRNDRLVCTGDVNRSHTEYAYDGAGRQYQVRVVNNPLVTKYSAGAFQYRAPAPHPSLSSKSSTGDATLIEFTHYVYDSADNKIEEHVFELNHTDSNGIDIDATDSYVRRTIFSWYDLADRLQYVDDYGADNGGTADSWKYSTERKGVGSLF
jgi:hypothetical protein